MHFGHCEKFALVDVDPVTKQITASSEVAAPEHQPGLLPPWLKERGVNLVIAGGMGARAQTLFQSEPAVDVLTGAPAESCGDYRPAVFGWEACEGRQRLRSLSSAFPAD